MTEAEAAIVVGRFVFDLAALMLWGAGAYVWLLVPAGLGRTVWRSLAVTRTVAIAGAALAVLAILPLRAVTFGEGWGDTVDPEILWLIVSATNIGTAWIVQAVAALALLLAALVLRAASPAATALLSGVMLLGLTFTGHAAMNEGWVRLGHQASTALHLYAAGGWIGALPVVVLILRRLRADDASRSDAISALMRFSTAGHVAVALTVLSGFANAALIVKGLPVNLESGYQRLLLAKVALVALMVAIAVVNRYVLVPRLRVHGERALVTGTIAEIALAAAVLALVAWFGTLDPGPPG